MDDADLLNRLLTLAGTIMEDSAPIAIIDTGMVGMLDRLQAVQCAGRDLLALASAIDVVRQRGEAIGP